MFRKPFIKCLRGQSLLHYVTVAGFVTAGLTMMSPAIKRTIQAAYKNVTDKVGYQNCSDAAAGDQQNNCAMPDPKKGYVDSAITPHGRKVRTTIEENKGDVIVKYDEANAVSPLSVVVSHYGDKIH